MKCVFCDKDKKITNIVYEDNPVTAFIDIDPINEGLILLIPKKHYIDVDDIPDDTLSHLIIISKKIVSALKKIYSPDGYSVMQNGGKFNDIGHYHMHIFPRCIDDGFGYHYNEENKSVNKDIVKIIKNKLN